VKKLSLSRANRRNVVVDLSDSVERGKIITMSVPPSSSSPPPRALTFYVFDRAGTCLHYADFGRTRSIAEGAGTPGDEAKMIFGLLFSLRTLTAALDPTA
jgi:Sybindin-like family